MSAPTIVWLRRDLRLADNPALQAAVQRRAPVLPVFLWTPEEDAGAGQVRPAEKEGDPAMPAPPRSVVRPSYVEAPWPSGAASRWWLHRSLEALQASLRSQGSDLIVRRGPAQQTLLDLAAATGAEAVFWNRLYDPAIVARDRAIKDRLRNRGIEVHSFRGNVLFEPWTIQNASSAPFRVFTAFWNACSKAAPPAAPLAAPQRIPAPPQMPSSLPIPALDLQPHVDWAAGLRETWQPGESGAARALAVFTSGGAASALDRYSSDRDRPDRPGTSRLSPHLHFGEISPQQIWHALHAVRAAAGPGAPEPYLRQLVWREFAHHLLFHFPQTSVRPMRAEFARFPWRMNPSHFEAWTRGLTGYPLVDAGMRELWHTGWMHNRVRMVAASFLVKHLLIPWQEGAAWFWDTLVDADLANNTLGWQWVAGCGADAAPYFRIFNPAIQAKKFDPDGAYVRRWVPEFGTPAYPPPVVEHEQARRRALTAFEEMRQ